ncbi:hypothetical protein [Elizabethkingia meningoseptica]|uniref:hypothetical protein n=1 Tax=Elizabethkingia meningoseptica TaxID=238 RepID=UPI0038920183
MKKLKRNSLKTILGGKLDCRCWIITYPDGSTSGTCATEHCSQISLACAQKECQPVISPID